MIMRLIRWYLARHGLMVTPCGHVAEVAVMISEDDLLLESARREIEAELVECRDSRWSELGRGNGLVIREKNGADSHIIRFGPETAMKLGLRAIATHLRRAPDDGGYWVLRRARALLNAEDTARLLRKAQEHCRTLEKYQLACVGAREEEDGDSSVFRFSLAVLREDLEEIAAVLARLEPPADEDTLADEDKDETE